MSKKPKKLQPSFDADLLVEVLSIQSYHDKDEDREMMTYIEKTAKELGAVVTKDAYGNIYAVKGNTNFYPCMVSHTDTVHKIHPSFDVFQSGDILFAFSETEGAQVGIGGDDKTGVALCLNMLQDLPAAKAVFFRHEEIGCKGSRACDMDFFSDCSIVLQADRRGNTDFITNASGTKLSSPEFQEHIKDILDAHCYKPENGMMTDVMALKQRGLAVCAANMSCGYHYPHTDSEIVALGDVEDCYNMIVEIFDATKDRAWPHEHTFSTAGIKEKPVKKNPLQEPPIPTDSVISTQPRPSVTLNVADSHTNDIIARMRHDMRPMVEDEDAEVEEILEEIDICITDIEGVMQDYKMLREKLRDKLGRL